MSQDTPLLIKKPRPNSAAAQAIALAATSDNPAGAEQFRMPDAQKKIQTTTTENREMKRSNEASRVGTYLDPDIRQRFHLTTVKNGTSMSKVLAEAVLAYLAKYE